MSARQEPRFFSFASSRIVSIDSSRARSMKAQVLTTRHSASSGRSASGNPASVSMPSISSESTWFFGQPRVVRWTFMDGSQYTWPGGPNRRWPEGPPSESRALAQKDVGRPFARRVLRAFVAQSPQIDVAQEMLPRTEQDRSDGEMQLVDQGGAQGPFSFLECGYLRARS